MLNRIFQPKFILLKKNRSMPDSEKKELGFERFIFFSDAIVAIAITLLALELKIDAPPGQHLTFKDLAQPWQKYLAFVLSFINIAGFWRTHHLSFSYIKKINERMLALNLVWLFFIVTLPFSTSLISTHFTDTPAIFLYCMNVFMLSVMQNFLWDYAAHDKVGFVEKEKAGEGTMNRMRIMFNLDMLNSLIAVVVSFFSPVTAFILLFFKIPLFVFIMFYIAGLKRKGITRPKKNGERE